MTLGLCYRRSYCVLTPTRAVYSPNNSYNHVRYNGLLLLLLFRYLLFGCHQEHVIVVVV